MARFELTEPKKLACVAQPILRELKHHRRRGQREQQRQNSNRFGLVKQQLCSWINLFCTFLCRHCRNTMWNRLISRSVEGVNLRECLSFSFPELPYSPSELIYRKIRQHLSNWTRNAIEFEAARIHFLSDAFVAVVLSSLKTFLGDLESCTENTPKSPFLCVNLYDMVFVSAQKLTGMERSLIIKSNFVALGSTQK